MATTHVVALFLPNTLKFRKGLKDSKAPTPAPSLPSPAPPSPPQIASPQADPTSRTEKRLSLPIELIRSPSATTSLFGLEAVTTEATLVTSASSHQLYVDPLTADYPKRHVAKFSDPRSLVQSDAEVSPWGAAQPFNQPRSKAGPLPSSSVLDFTKVHDQLKKQKPRPVEKRVTPPISRESRGGSGERTTESPSWTVEPPIRGNGGLTNAMRAVTKSGLMEVSWIGTLGFPTDALSSSLREQIDDHMLNEYHSDVVYCTDKDLHAHYHGYCKTILWPIFHYHIPDHPKSKAYADHSWDFYFNVNRAFADKVIASYRRGDTIWIHDYHLLLVPGMVREKLPTAQIGFFLHTAFPSSEVVRCLPTRRTLLEGMLGANLVAFQTTEYSQHFLQACSRLLNLETTEEGVQLPDRFVNVTSQAIGVDPPALHEARQEAEVEKWIDILKERYGNKRLIVARDKLDNVHGIEQKLLGYEKFLDKYPAWRHNTVLIQVATSASQETERLREVTRIISRIDGKYSDVWHRAVMFLKQDINFAQCLALLSMGDCMMITPLRDGMSLSAADYAICQDGSLGGKKHGPLILSEFTGSSAVLHGHISVNPWDNNMMATAINQALEMSDAERQQRWSHLHSSVLRHTGQHWAEELNHRLGKAYDEQSQRSSIAVPRLSTSLLCEKYKQTSRRVLFIDYEGTLAPHRTTSGISLAQPERIIEVLNELVADPKNTVYVMSGRSAEELSAIFRTAPGLGLIAENGCFMRKAGKKAAEWRPLIDVNHANRWKKDVKQLLQYFLERSEGSFIEERHCSLRFHYDKVEDQVAAMRQAGDFAEQINSGCKSFAVHAIPIAGAILIEPSDANKATAAAHIFDAITKKQSSVGAYASPSEFLLVAGDDREDEVVFRWANNLGKQGIVKQVSTISIGSRNTEAQAALVQGSTGLLGVLEKLGQVSRGEPVSESFDVFRGRPQVPS